MVNFDFLSLLLGIIIALVSSFFANLWWNKYVSPHLTIRTLSEKEEQEKNQGNVNTKFVHLRIKNEGRSVAFVSQASIKFEGDKKEICGRWDAKGEPRAFVDNQQILLMSSIPEGSKIDTRPKSETDLVIAWKEIRAMEAYAFNDWNYAYGFKYEKHKLVTNEQIITVTLYHSGGEEKPKKFKLKNSGDSLDNFYLCNL